MLFAVVAALASAGAVIFTVGFEYEQPQIATKVANDFVTMILDEDVRARTAYAAETSRFLAEDVKKLEAQLTAISAQISEQKRRRMAALGDIGMADLFDIGDARLFYMDPVPPDVLANLPGSPLWQSMPFAQSGHAQRMASVLMFGTLPAATRFARLLVEGSA